MVNKQQITDGIIKFIESDMIPEIEDKNLQILLNLATGLIKTNDKLIDGILQNQIITMFFPYSESEKTWDIDNGFTNLQDTLKKYGSLKVIIPNIPFINPEVKELRFNANDITKLKKYITGEN